MRSPRSSIAHLPRWRAGLLLAPLLLACSGSPSQRTDGGATDARTPPVAPQLEPEPLVLAEWRAGRLPSADRDPVRAAVEGGTFRLPQPGVDENGISWRRVEPGPSGGLGGDIGPGIGYAAARFVEDRPRRIIARADRALGIYLNGFLQPGDFYGSRRMRV